MDGDLRTRALASDLAAEVHGELVGGFACLRKRLRCEDCPRTDIDCSEGIERIDVVHAAAVGATRGEGLRSEPKAVAYAKVAQLVEHAPEKCGVGSSILPLGRFSSRYFKWRLFCAKALPGIRCRYCGLYEATTYLSAMRHPKEVIAKRYS